MQRGRFLNLAALAGALSFAVGVAPAALAGPTLPTGFSAQDVGAVKAGDTSVSGTGASAMWTLTSQGGDIQKKGDFMRYVYTNLTGDGGITARLLSQMGGAKGGWAKSGVMLRESTDPGSVMDMIAYGSPGTSNKTPQFEVINRPATGATVVAADQNLTAPVSPTNPYWFRAQRQGTTFQLLSSTNGQDWKLEDSRTINVAAGETILAGLAQSSGNATDPPAVGVFDNVSVSSDIIQPNVNVPGPTPVVVMPGNGEVLLTFPTQQGVVGYNIYRQVAGSTTPPMLVNSQPDPYGWFVDTGLTNGTNYLYSVSTITQSRADTTKTLEGAQSAQVLATPQVAVAVPSGSLTSIDIGTTTPGMTTLDNGVLTITASGGDIWNAADSFRFVGGVANGDYSISAELLAKPAQGPKNTSTWVKAGVMIRESLDPAAREAWCVSTSGNGVQFGYRNVYNSSSSTALVGIGGTNNAKTTYPIWLQLSRSGDNISGYQSSDGTTWTQIGTAISFPSLSRYTYTGLAVTAHTSDQKSSTLLGSAMFDAASIRFGAPYVAPTAPAAPTTGGTTAGTTTAGTTGATTTGGTTTGAATTGGTTTGTTTGTTP